MMLGPRQALYRANSGGVELRLRVDPDGSWVVIKRPGGETKYFYLPDDQIGAVTAFFPADGDSPERVQVIRQHDRSAVFSGIGVMNLS